MIMTNFRRTSSMGKHRWVYEVEDQSYEVECTEAGWIKCTSLTPPNSATIFLAVVSLPENRSCTLMCKNFIDSNGKFHAEDTMSSIRFTIEAWRPSPVNDLSNKIEKAERNNADY